MTELIEWTNTQKTRRELHPILVIAVFVCGLNDWLEFFLKSMQKQKVALEAKMKDELVATKMPRLSLQIIELIKSLGATSIGEAVAATGANRNTVKLHFKNLVADGHLEKEGVGRGMRYRMRF